MPREKEDFRDIYADILEHFEGKKLLTRVEVGSYLKIDPRTAAKRFGIGKDGIAARSLARQLSSLCRN